MSGVFGLGGVVALSDGAAQLFQFVPQVAVLPADVEGVGEEARPREERAYEQVAEVALSG